MTLSRQDSFSSQGSPASTGRANQKARTRNALVQAAAELVREGQPPSIPDAAERALVSVATAYRYFPSADELWSEAASAVLFEPLMAESEARIRASGDDPVARLDALVRSNGFLMLDDQAPYRRLARAALDLWFRQAELPPSERAPVRQGRRRSGIDAVVEPLRTRLPEADVTRIARALGIVIGTEAVIALVDGMGLDVDDAKATLTDAARWMLVGALSELDA